jgi:hypothetical protein
MPLSPPVTMARCRELPGCFPAFHEGAWTRRHFGFDAGLMGLDLGRLKLFGHGGKTAEATIRFRCFSCHRMILLWGAFGA